MPTEIDGIYNLAFGDIIENGEIDDYCITDNGDRNKILATVFDVVNTYTARYPERMIYFRGSTIERTRLYRIAIGLNLEELSRVFDIYRSLPYKKKTIKAPNMSYKEIFLNCDMKKRESKVKTPWGHELTLTVDEELNKLKGKVLAPKKLDEANKRLRRMKGFPK